MGEAVIDELAADQLGLAIGGTATVLGVPLRVTGLSNGGTSITNTTVYVSLTQFNAQRGPTVSYLLVGADPSVTPDALTRVLTGALPGTTAQTREQFTASESRIVTDMSADLLRLMSLIALLIALAVIALGLLTSTLARLRDYAVLKALGASTRRLSGTVASQVLWTGSPWHWQQQQPWRCCSPPHCQPSPRPCSCPSPPPASPASGSPHWPPE